MQYVQCKFRLEDGRSYTYHYDGEEAVNVGDQVKVADRSGDGWKRVHVVGITDDAPNFPTKPILGFVEEEKPAEDAGEAAVDDDADFLKSMAEG